MTTKQIWRVVGLASISAFLCAHARADDRYYYGGISAGQSKSNLEEDKITRDMAPPGSALVGITKHERDTAYKVYGGYQFNSNFAMEGGYFQMGQPHFVSTVSPAGTLNGEVRTKGWNLDLVGLLPMSESVSAFARVGAQYAKATGEFSGTGAVVVTDPHRSEYQVNYKGGLGLQYAFTPSFLVRGEIERYRVSDSVGNHNGINALTLGLVFPFGRSPGPSQHAMAEQPATVAMEPNLNEMPPPAAGPVAPVAPAPFVPAPAARVSYTAESLFGFDQSEVRPEGKAALDNLATELNGAQVEAVVIEGHADRLGTEEYNEKLSVQRAEAVKAYLVDTGKVDAAKITATGKSEGEPVTTPEECKGNRPTAKLIACLQPDRRVVIQVGGTR